MFTNPHWIVVIKREYAWVLLLMWNNLTGILPEEQARVSFLGNLTSSGEVSQIGKRTALGYSQFPYH